MPIKKRGLAALGSALLLAGCGAAGATGDGGGTDGRLSVLTTFYPLQFVAEQVGGDLAAVQNLTPAGAEPHDLELSPVDILTIEGADVLLYLSGFQPAVDASLETTSGPVVLDTAAAAHLLSPEELGGGHDEHEDEHADHDHGHDGHDGHDHGPLDAHFWLDPTRLAEVATAVAGAFADADPDNAETYAANAETLGAELGALDEELATGLATCSRHVVVVSHEAFGYLTSRYGLEQVGISGLDPESEPAPARLAEIRAVVEEEGVDTIFTEALVSPKVAEVLAAETGADVAVLDPLEGVAEGETYLTVMRSNLQALAGALDCS